MKRRFFAGIAAAVLSMSACTLNAGAVYMETTSDTWNGMQRVDDKGMLGWTAYSGNYGVYMYETGGFLVIDYIDNQYRFTLKPNLEADETVRELVSSCYPDDDSFDVSYNGYTDQPYYTVYDYTEEPDVYADAVMQALLSKGLISAFYGIGQIGAVHYPTLINGLTSYKAALRDSEAVQQLQAYLDAAELNCTLQYYGEDDILPGGLAVSGDYTYCVVPNEELTHAERFALVANIYEALGFCPDIIFTVSSETCITGQNALEYPGDLNIDGAADVSDAVLLARIIAEDDSMPAICDTGYLNADVDGDGLLTILDVTVLLETLVN